MPATVSHAVPVTVRLNSDWARDEAGTAASIRFSEPAGNPACVGQFPQAAPAELEPASRRASPATQLATSLDAQSFLGRRSGLIESRQAGESLPWRSEFDVVRLGYHRFPNPSDAFSFATGTAPSLSLPAARSSPPSPESSSADLSVMLKLADSNSVIPGHLI